MRLTEDFGSAPKFPHPANLDRLLRDWRATANSAEPDKQALFICALTLSRMADGGIYDQLGGGFCRYSVDQEWTIPHFEKMLYDNGPLLALYAQLWPSVTMTFTGVSPTRRRTGFCGICALPTGILLNARCGFGGAGRSVSMSGRPTKCATF